MGHFIKYRWKYGFTLILLAFSVLAIILIFPVKTLITTHSAIPLASLEPQSTIRISSSHKQTEQWKPADAPINLSSQQAPIVLSRTPVSVLYIWNQKLQFMQEGKQPVVLYQWSKLGIAQAWNWEEGILIGLPYLNSVSETGVETQSGEWLLINLASNDSGELPTAQILENFMYNPEDLLEIRYAPQSHLAILGFQQTGLESGFERFIDTETGITNSIETNMLRNHSTTTTQSPISPTKKTKAVKQIQIKPWDNEISTFSDDRGTILFRKDAASSYLEARRYPYMELKDYRYIYNETDKVSLLYLQLMDVNQQSYLKPFNYMTFAPFEPVLWEQGWKALSQLSFYRLGSEQLEAIQYDYLPLKDEIVVHKNTLPLDGAVLQAQNSFNLSFLHDAQEQSVNIYDLLNLADNRNLDTLWLKDLPAGTLTLGEKPSFNSIYEETEKTAEHIKLPQYLETDTYLSDESDLPEEVKQSVDIFIDDTGDFQVRPLLRKFADVWHWIIGSQFYRYDKAEAYKLIGTLPIKSSATVSQAAALVGTKDYLLLGDSWIILDTTGNRVVKLDQALHILNEVQLEAPFRINASSSQEQFEVESLHGITLLNDQLQIIHTKPLPYQSVLTTDLKEHRILPNGLNPEAIIRDSKSGWIWYYDSESGALYQYNSITKKARAYPVGYQRNLRIPVRLLKNGEQSVLLFDQFAYLFDKAGNWISTITYERSEPDSIYDTTTSGEGTLIWDEAHTIIYFNQGYRLLAIDLKLSTATPIFQQNNANTGPILLNENHLFFTLQSKLFWGQDMNKNSTTELIKLDIRTNSYKRYSLEGYWEVEAIEEGMLTLWSFDEPRSGNYKGTYQTILLNTLPE